MFRRALIPISKVKNQNVQARIFWRTIQDEIKLSESDPVSAEDITQHLDEHGISYKKGHACIRTSCLRFTRPKLKLDKLNQIYVNSTTGYFVCVSCKKSGPWAKLKDNISELSKSFLEDKKQKPPRCFKYWSEEHQTQSHTAELSALLKGCLSEPLPDSDFEGITQILGMHGITQDTFRLFGAQILSNIDGIVLPCYDIDMNYQCAKVIALNKETLETKTIPRQNYSGLFGWNLAKSKKKVVLTSSEVDAMAVYQQTGIAAIALPRGISHLSQQALPFLESFDKIIIWFDNDVQAFENAKAFAAKLGLKRTAIIRPELDSPGPLKALTSGLSLKNILAKSISLVHEHVITFSTFREDVKHELAFSNHVAGVKWKNFPKLTEILKGHRRGELTVFTGGTGSGKTTFLSDYSLDLCSSGVNTLWGSFEISNIRLMKLMLQQYARTNLFTHMEEYNDWADKFEMLSMYFMNFHGQENIHKVIETMSHAVYIYDISHVIVDNLQFMMGTLVNGQDRFVKQDQIISAFRQFATNMNCHITLVIHPRKENEEALTTNSIFGGAKASQEADNILILQTSGIPGSTRTTKYIQVTKNRFDGSLGSMRLTFNKEYKSFVPTAAKAADYGVSTISPKRIARELDTKSNNNASW